MNIILLQKVHNIEIVEKEQEKQARILVCNGVHMCHETYPHHASIPPPQDRN